MERCSRDHLKIHWFGMKENLQRFNEWLVSRWVNRFHTIIVPDYEEDSLSGSLSRDFKYIDEKKIFYIGILSSVSHMNVEKDIDYFICISGTEPQRSSFEKLVIKQLHKLTGKVVVVLGRPEKSQDPIQIDENTTIYNVCYNSLKNSLFNKSKRIIARSGYSILMDIAETKKSHVLFVPTPNHTEQEYLAWYHKKKGNIFSVNQKSLDLLYDVERAKVFNGVPRHANRSTQDSVDRFKNILAKDGVI
jgi:hypothetical protein